MTGTVVVIAVVVAILLLTSAVRARHCPECDTRIPPIRRPDSLRQLVWGGSTCPSCGHEVDGMGEHTARALALAATITFGCPA
jgi:endogenous inhibitor of DNA gyrase (YacG/DUF329 family)